MTETRTTVHGSGLVTEAHYAEILYAQDGACAICRQEPAGVRLAVDHDHRTGLVRGLLCHRCNAGLGLLADSPDLLERAIGYLTDHQLHAETANRLGLRHTPILSTDLEPHERLPAPVKTPHCTVCQAEHGTPHANPHVRPRKDAPSG